MIGDDRRQAIRFAAPAALALALVAVGPIAGTAWLSLRRVFPVFGEDAFVGLANFHTLLSDARFWGALANTAWFTVAAVALELALGLPVALLLHRAGRGRQALRAAVLVPWILPTAVAARLWGLLLQPDLGPLARIAPGVAAGLLARPVVALHAAILVDVWKTTPLVAVILLAGLQSIPAEVLEAARVDGASGLRAFRSVTLPLLAPAIGVAALFRALDAFRVFDAILVLTEGGPGHATESLSVYAFRTLLRAGNVGLGSALALVTFAGVLVIALAGIGRLARGAGEGAR